MTKLVAFPINISIYTEGDNMKWILLLSMLSMSVFATTDKAPHNFQIKNTKAVFVDFKNINATITYDLNLKEVIAESIIEFTVDEQGQPIFDLVPSIESAYLDGVEVTISSISAPDKSTDYRLVNKILKPGTYSLIVKNKISENVSFSSDYVSSAFWMSDLSDRQYIEQYLPTNLEYDQYGLSLTVEINGSKKLASHEIFTNGNLTKTSENKFQIQFPSYFTASSFFFHLTKEDRFSKVQFDYKSIIGKTIPVVIYASSSWSLNSAKKSTIQVLDELEQKLGPWSHPSLTIYLAGQGGMEHSGATMTSLWALQHEITHSYFARGVMPVDGNSGWMDEAIASWRDDGYKSVSSPNFSSTSMSGHSMYRRHTDRKAYTQGANFMAYLNNRLEDQGGLIKFLSFMHLTYTHHTISTKDFVNSLLLFTGIDFTNEFAQYVYGKNLKHDKDHSHEENPYHPKLTKKQLKDLL